MQSLTFSKKDPPIGAVLTCQAANIPYEWKQDTQLVLDDSISLTNSQAISRHLARLHPGKNLYPLNILQRTEVDHWLGIANKLRHGDRAASDLEGLNAALAQSHSLVPPHFTIADFEIFGVLYCSSEFQELLKKMVSAHSHIFRWYKTLCSKFSKILASLPDDVRKVCPATQESDEEEQEEEPSAGPSAGPSCSAKSAPKKKTPPPARGKTAGGRKEEGRFVELPDAKMGEVVVRFPPEASGYLHIGHAKAALLNQHYQLAFKGKLIMRFDDTNPAKENEHFENVILEDLKLMNIKPDRFTHTSDYFDLMIDLCTQLIKDGFAYVDDTDAETMKAERDERKDSKNKSNDVQKNLKMWEQMKKGEAFGLKCCVRAKIDMKSNNGCMRDPTIYRCKVEPHIKTGLKYKVYPTYDFACPIVDSIEGVTHALRTTEYHDRDEQFFWFLEKLKLRKLHVYEYSRLNMNNTVLSKRKLAWFVEQGYVDGWDDPRFPTVRGILRRGMTVEGLKEFIIAQGSSRSVVNMEWDKIWTFNKKVIDATAPRYVGLVSRQLVTVCVSNATEQALTVNKHPKDASIGTKTVWVGPKVLIEAADAELLYVGEKATFINWGNLMIKKLHYCLAGNLYQIDADTILDDTNYKKTLKVTWLPNSKNPHTAYTPLVCVEFDQLVNKGVLGKDEDFKNFVGHKTRFQIPMIGDYELRNLKKGDIIQLQRKGFYIVDQEYKESDFSTFKESPVVLFYIPDGHTKESPAKAAPFKQERLAPKICVYETLLKVEAQEDKIRKLKSEKAAKEVIKREAITLIELKALFEVLTDTTWTDDYDISKFKAAAIEANTSVTSTTSCPIYETHLKVVEQGDKIRKLKSEKAAKDVIMPEVNTLKDLKAQFKTLSGMEWTPEIDVSKFKSTTETSATTTGSCPIYDAHLKVVAQGDQIRRLKSEKAAKDIIMPEVDTLKELKAQFKTLSGLEWTPEIDMSKFKPNPAKTATETSSATTSSSCPIYDAHLKVVAQGDRIRKLKSEKVAKDVIMPEVDTLKDLKAKFKTLSGMDWTPEIDVSKFKPASAQTTTETSSYICPIYDAHLKVVAQGDQIRKLKSEKAAKDVIMPQVNTLKELKAQFKTLSGLEWTPEIDMSKFKPTPAKTTTETSPATTSSCPIYDAHLKVVEQGDQIRKLKSEKAAKDVIMPEVNTLKQLKAQFKTLSGLEWTPEIDMSKFKPTPAKTTTETSSATTNSCPIYSAHLKVVEQGDKIRKLKSEKATKDVIMPEVNTLKDLKAQFKTLSGMDWTPEIDMSKFKPTSTKTTTETSSAITSSSCPIYNAHLEVVEQGDKIRKLKSEKAAKDVIMPEVNTLKDLKAKFKTISGMDWTPEIDMSKFKPKSAKTTLQTPTSSACPIYDAHLKVVEQGDKIRKLKSEKVAKDVIMPEVNTLKDFKTLFKTLSGMDWTPEVDVSKFQPSAAKSVSAPTAEAPANSLFESLNLKVKTQGDKIRQLKSSGADKAAVKAEVDVLLALKQEFKAGIGCDWKPDVKAPSTSDVAVKSVPASRPPKQKEAKKQPVKEEKVDDGKKQTRLGLEAKKSENLSDWYSQIITKSEMIEYYNVSGCYILLPWSYGIWEHIKEFIDEFIKGEGVKNCYFPLFVSKEVLEKEKDHIADFSPEVAWVTRSGSSELAEPIAIRPTSETVMYPTIAKRIQSHRDLPMKLNQWNNVVRWEFKQPTPFLRTREFLWQEGHSAFQKKAEACEEVYVILDLYERVYKELLALPVVKGKKTEKEKFAGGVFTLTTEAFVSANGRAIQGATSHHLGQNFSKMFNIVYEDPATKEKKFVYQNSWGITTRTIGVMVMVHGDDKGLVLPPKVAEYQVIVMPVGTTSKLSEQDKSALYDQCANITAQLSANGVRAFADLRDDKTPSWKFNHWELKGVPLRMEIGPREAAAGMVSVVVRHNGVRENMPQADIAPGIKDLLVKVHNDMFEKANNELTSHKKVVSSWPEFCSNLDEGNLLLAPFCGIPACEDRIKNDSARDEDLEAGAPSMGAKSLCIPFEQPEILPLNSKCIYPSCAECAVYYTMFGRSY